MIVHSHDRKNRMNRTNRRLLGIIAAEILALVALGFVAVTVIRVTSREEPITVIDSPASNSEYHAGEEVAIQSTSTDPTGVARVDLVVDGTVIRTDVPPQPQVTFTVIQTWIATEG